MKKLSKKILGYGIDIFFGYLGTQIGMNIAYSLGIVDVPDSLIIDGISGFLVFGYFGAKLNNTFNENKEFILKISRLKKIKTDFHGSNNELMLSYASIQMLDHLSYKVQFL